MKLAVFGQTDVGKSRSHNEDFLLKDHELGLYAVCDGMGGHAAGEVASETAAQSLDEYVRAHKATIDAYDGTEETVEDVRALLRNAIEHANTRVREVAQSDKGKPGMGTTCVSMIVLGGKAVMGHVGDSRLFMFRDGKVYQLSEDHTYVNDAIRHGLMTREQALASPFAHAVTRGVGMSDTIAVDTLVFDVLPGDNFLLCSDGMYEYFENNQEVAKFLSEDSAEELPGRLVGMANDRGGKDNITALLVRAEDDAEDGLSVRRKTQVSTNMRTLRFISLVQELTSSELVRVLNAFNDARFDAGQNIIEEGDTSEHLYVIVEGECSVMRHGEHMALLQAGSHFGEMALLNRRPRTATVRAKTDVRLLALSRHDFNSVIRQDSTIAAKFLWKLAQSLSLRLDDVYLLRDQDAEAAKRTQRIAVLSPFLE
jgi:serine/threonine protein phosphatase PrpC